MSDPLLIGVDLGTARVKVGIFDPLGTQHSLSIVPHSTLLGPHAQVTQDAEVWWEAVCRGIRETIADVDAAHVTALSVCGQGPTLVATDAALRPRGPALTWMDQRADREARELAERLGRPVDPSRHVAKALMLAQREPDQERRWFFQAWDMIASRLCRVPMTSSAWDEQEIAAADLPRAQFPPYIAAGTSIGVLDRDLARALGLPDGVTVIAGTNDSIASCIGSGTIERGRSVILGGTSGGFVVCWDRLPGIWTPPPDTYPEPEGLAYLGAAISSSGLLVDWIASLTGAAAYDGWVEQAAAVPAGADGLVLLPYIAGIYLPYAADERAPLNDPAARGLLFGLDLRHTSMHLVRAALEGVAYAVRQIYELAQAQGGVTVETVSVGGQAHSDIWNRIKADVLGLPVLLPRVREAGALGAACLAAAGSGLYSDIWQASRAMVHLEQRLNPDPVAHARYDELYGSVYSALYPRLRDLFAVSRPVR
jgi:xylulokinase